MIPARPPPADHLAAARPPPDNLRVRTQLPEPPLPSSPQEREAFELQTAHLDAMLQIYARQGDQITVKRIFDAKAKLVQSLTNTRSLERSTPGSLQTCGDCHDGYVYELRCCGNPTVLPDGPHCCLAPDTITHECDACGATGIRTLFSR